jgi:AbrB family looped-hinge helix DNA binding protein
MIRKLDSLGRLVIPIEIRRHLGIEEGDAVVMNNRGNVLEVRKYRETDSYKNTLESLLENLDSSGVEDKELLREKLKQAVALVSGK